ncbi:MAG: nuclear transport factor 2 family protein [Solirubrobacterales bacterium]
MADASEHVARAFVEAFNDRDLDRFVAVLDPEVEIHSMRGTVRGSEAARGWATRAPGGVQQTIEIVGSQAVPGMVLLDIDRVWHWEEDGSYASTDEMAWLFEVEGGLVTSWRPFEDRAEAREALREA